MESERHKANSRTHELHSNHVEGLHHKRRGEPCSEVPQVERQHLGMQHSKMVLEQLGLEE